MARRALPQQPQLFTAARPDPYRAVATTPELVALLLAGAPVAIGVSGGKDSCAQAFAVMAYLDAIGHTGPRVLVHADLGRVEWKDSLPTCQDNEPIYREMVDLEIASTFSLQADRWLGHVAPHLLSEEQRAQLEDAIRMASVRQAEEARIPTHLLYEKGWPTVLPTAEEAALLADVRLKVSAAVGLDGMDYLDPVAVMERYAELYQRARAA